MTLLIMRLNLADGLMIIDVIDGEPMTFSQQFFMPGLWN